MYLESEEVVKCHSTGGKAWPANRLQNPSGGPHRQALAPFPERLRHAPISQETYEVLVLQPNFLISSKPDEELGGGASPPTVQVSYEVPDPPTCARNRL